MLYVNNQLVMSLIISLKKKWKKKIYHYVLCKERDCLDVSQEERARIKTAKKKQMFNHSFIFKKDLAYNPKVQMWWLVYIEEEGQYCLICKKFNVNSSNLELYYLSSSRFGAKLWNVIPCNIRQHPKNNISVNKSITIIFYK